MSSLVVKVYGRKGCKLCKEAVEVIRRVNKEMPFQFSEVDVTTSEDLVRMYANDVPTVFINGKKVFKFKVDEAEFRKRVRKEFIKAGLSRLNRKKELLYSPGL
jgi:glutaredoxin